MDAWIRDARLAVRGILRTPRQSAFVLLVLALALGGNAALFTLLDALVLRPLPVPGADRLVVIRALDARGRQQLVPLTSLTELTTRQTAFDAVSGYTGSVVRVSVIKGQVGWVGADIASGDFYETLGVKPALGRLLTREDSLPGRPASAVAVMNHRYWQREFDSDPSVVGQTVTLGGVVFTVVGVAPADFPGVTRESQSAFTIPLNSTMLMGPLGDPRVGVRSNFALAKLKPGVTIEAAGAELRQLWPAVQSHVLPAAVSGADRDAMVAQALELKPFATGFSPLRDRHETSLRTVVWLTMALLGLAAINIGALFVARATARHDELMVRLDLGANRLDLARLFLVEAAVWCVLASAAAIPLALWLSGFIANTLWTGLSPLQMSLLPGVRAWLLFAAAIFGTTLMVGALPAVLFARRLAGGSRTARTTTRRASRWGHALLVGQLAASLGLTFGSALLARNLAQWWLVDPGFDARDVTMLGISTMPGADVGQDLATYRPSLVRALQAVPGVKEVALSRTFGRSTVNIVLREPVGRAGAADERTEVAMDYVSPGLFDVLRVPLVAGRDFTWGDTSSSPPVAIVTTDIASRLFPGENAVGQRLLVGRAAAPEVVEIVGVSAPFRSLDTRVNEPLVLRPAIQSATFYRLPMALVRSEGPLNLDAAQQAVSSFGREYVLSALPAHTRTAKYLAGERTTAFMAFAAAALGLLLAAAGVHSVLSASLTRRRREFGVRVALGASAEQMRKLVWAQTFGMAIAGVAIGVPCALAVGRLLRAVLAGVSDHDPTALGVSAALLVVVGVAAAIGPARRIGRTDAMSALRGD